MKIGDHIKVKRTGYWHHGIYCGHNSVIHYTGTPFNYKEACIEKCTIEKFSKGKKIEIVSHVNMLPRKEIIKRAESRIGEKNYCVIRENCEHFATWCCTGKSISKQINDTLVVSAAIGIIVISAIIGNRK